MSITDYLTSSISVDEAVTDSNPQDEGHIGLLDRIRFHNSPFDENGNFNIYKYFHIHHWHIKKFVDCGENESIFKLSEEIVNAYPTCKGFLKYLRYVIEHKQFRFVYHLDKHTAEEKDKIIFISKRMYESGIFRSCITKKNEVIGKISDVPKVLNYIQGQFMELFAFKTALNVIKEISTTYDFEYNVFLNAKIISADERLHEMAILFYINEMVFCVEVKPDKFTNYMKYRDIGKEIDVNPNRQLLLTAEIPDETSAEIEYFYDMYVSDLGNFSEKLKTMIQRAIINEGQYKKINRYNIKVVSV